MSFLLLGSLIIGGVAGVLGLMAGHEKAKTETAAKIKQQELQAMGMTRDENAYNNAVTNEQLQWQDAQNQAFQRAQDTEDMAKLGYSGTMEQTYLGNLQAAAGLADMAQQNKANLDQFGAAQGASGVKQNTRYSDILGEQMKGQQDLAKTVTERGTAIQVNQAQGQFNQAMNGVNTLRTNFSAGGNQFNIYQHRLASMSQSYTDGAKINQTQYDYMGDMIMQGSVNAMEGGKPNPYAFLNMTSLFFNAGATGIGTGTSFFNAFGGKL
jgi:hypothetical protein